MERVPPETHLLSVGQLSARSGVAVSALHFYEAQGLIYAQRSPGNQRRYARETLRRVGFIRASQAVGIRLRAIKEAGYGSARVEGLPSSSLKAGRRPGRTGRGFPPDGRPTSTNASAISSRCVTASRTASVAGASRSTAAGSPIPATSSAAKALVPAGSYQRDDRH